MLALIEFLARQSRLPLLGWGAAVLAIVSALSYVAGADFAVPLLYFLPVTVISWFAGLGSGIAISAASALLWLGVDLAHDPGGPWDRVVWNTLIRLSCFLTLATFLAASGVAFKYARTDALTGIPNGRAFYDAAHAETNRSRRYAGAFTVIHLAVDDLQAVNERFGHSVGDALVRSVAVTLRASLRSTDMVARLSADHFALLMPETGPEAAQGVLRKLEAVLRVVAEKGPWSSRFSVGAVTYRSAPDTVESALNRAEDLMHAARRAEAGQARVRCCAESVPVEEAIS